MKKTIMEWGKEHGTTNSPSVDVIILDKGYTNENVRSINMNKLNHKNYPLATGD